MTETIKTHDTSSASEDANDYKYLIGTIHRDGDDDLELYRTVHEQVDVVDEEVGPRLMAFRPFPNKSFNYINN